MGCINSNENFEHWFGNIHLSGPCNRSCYFCIGQHMQALDPFNNLDTWPLENIDKFVEECNSRGITDVNITGSNTDPLLHKHLKKIVIYLKQSIPHVKVGLRTNGILAPQNADLVSMFDKVSISVTSFNGEIYKKTMGNGSPPDIGLIAQIKKGMDIKLNVVLCPEITSVDLGHTLEIANDFDIKRVNLREPYGQPRVGNPFADGTVIKTVHGMPCYKYKQLEVTYWDVHYVEVESVNLYANGNISTTYPVTKGHHESGEVIPQGEWVCSGRQFEQWKNYD